MKDYGYMLQRFEKVGQFFKEKRTERGLTQSELAKTLGFKSAQIVSNWERGLCAPPLQSIGEMVKVLDLDVEEVLDIITAQNREYLLKQMTPKSSKKKSAS